MYQRKVNDIVSIDNSDIFFQYEKRLYLILIYLTIETVFKTADLEKKVFVQRKLDGPKSSN